jgi:hypothetical protein
MQSHIFGNDMWKMGNMLSTPLSSGVQSGDSNASTVMLERFDAYVAGLAPLGSGGSYQNRVPLNAPRLPATDDRCSPGKDAPFQPNGLPPPGGVVLVNPGQAYLDTMSPMSPKNARMLTGRNLPMGASPAGPGFPGIPSAQGAPFDESKEAGAQTISMEIFNEMLEYSKQLNKPTVWLRVVHSGYGQEPWRMALRNCGLRTVLAQSPAEGAYVNAPENCDASDVATYLTEINLLVRRVVRFKEMSRANKSRLQFKSEPIVVHPWDKELPKQYPTNRLRRQEKCDAETLKLTFQRLGVGQASSSLSNIIKALGGCEGQQYCELGNLIGVFGE